MRFGNAVSGLFLLFCTVALSWNAAAARRSPDGPEAVATAVDPWAATPADRRRALPNNSAPPDLCMPRTLLPPLPPEEQGTIRRVDVPGGDKVAALTFDLCELATATTGYDAAIINFLRRERIPATLFAGGKWMRTHASRMRQLLAEPLFEIGNHAWTHGNFGIMGPDRMREQIFRTQAQYELLRADVRREAAARGRPEPDIPPAPTLFRLPYGRCSDQALKLLAEAGLRVIQWDVAAEAAADNSRPGLAEEVARRVRPGSILLFHANLVPKGSATLLEGTVRNLQRRGYRFVTVGALLNMGAPQRTRDGYFNKPGDNRPLDARFGIDGTGLRR